MDADKKPNLTPEQIAIIQKERQEHYSESADKFMEMSKFYLDEAEKNTLKINAGGVIATLALIGQALTHSKMMASILLIPAVGFTVGLLASVLILYTRSGEASDYAMQLQRFVLNLPEDYTEPPKITSNSPLYIRRLTQTSGWSFLLSAVAVVAIFALTVLAT